MKKIACTLVITFLMGLSVSLFAQKPPVGTVAFLNFKTAKKVVDDQTAIITFQLSNITDETVKQKYQNGFSKQQRIQKVTASLQKGNMASFSIQTDKTGTVEILQRLFMKAHIESVNIDGTVVPTKDLAKYKNKNAKK